MPSWIDFKQLRQHLNFEAVLRHYGVEPKIKGKQHHGYCPLANHKGKKNSVSFSANVEKGIFQCFGCGAKGNILEFAALMENVNPCDGVELRKVAEMLQKKFCPNAAQGELPRTEKKVESQAISDLPVIVNAPLDFELKCLNGGHPYLLNRGFSAETIAHFGVGFCSRGFLKDRLAIPLHDHNGKLVGYAGRVADDATITEDNPKYRFPSKRERKGTLFEFRKTLFLYNGFRIKVPADEIILVEGFPSVWWLHQHGLAHVVAAMGSDLSETQAKHLVGLAKSSGRVWLMPDGDAAGERFAHSVLPQVTPHRFVRWVKLDEGRQPTDLSAQELERCFIV